MNFNERLRRLSVRLTSDDEDLRHTLLDVSDEFLAIAADATRFPESARPEVFELAEALDAIKPRFPSHRETSVLFDRQGVGQAGKKKAADLTTRIIAVCRVTERFGDGEP